MRTWVNQYQINGYQGLTKSMSKTHYSSDFKLAVLNYRQENQLSYRETANHCGIKQASTIVNWNRKLQEESPAALKGKIGRLRKTMSDEEKN